MDSKEVRLTAQDLIKQREQEKAFAATWSVVGVA
jgi:hypothetical protein